MNKLKNKVPSVLLLAILFFIVSATSHTGVNRVIERA